MNFTLLHDCIPNVSWSMKCFNILCDPMRLTFRNLWGYIFGCLSNLVCFRCLLKDIRVELRISSYKGNDWFWNLYMNICYRFGFFQPISPKAENCLGKKRDTSVAWQIILICHPFMYDQFGSLNRGWCFHINAGLDVFGFIECDSCTVFIASKQVFYGGLCLTVFGPTIF